MMLNERGHITNETPDKVLDFSEQAKSFIADADIGYAMFELVLSAYTAGALFMANAARMSFTKATKGMWEEDFDEAAKNGAVLDTNA